MREVYVTAAYVLKNRPYKEDSSELILFTEKLGKIHAVAQASRRVGATFAAASQIGVYAKYSIIRGKHTWRIRGAHEIQVFPMLHATEARSAYLRILGILARFIPYEETHSRVFIKLTQAAQALFENLATDRIEAEYILETLTSLGYAREHDVSAMEVATLVAEINKGIYAAQL